MSDDVLMFVPMTTTLISLVVVVLSTSLMWFESADVITNLIEFEYVLVVATLMLAKFNLVEFHESFVPLLVSTPPFL